MRTPQTMRNVETTVTPNLSNTLDVFLLRCKEVQTTTRAESRTAASPSSRSIVTRMKVSKMGT